LKNFGTNSVFQGKCRLFKILNDKKCNQYSEFREHSVFQGKHKLLKNPGCKNYIQYSEKFQEKLYFQSKRNFLKNPYFSAVKTSTAFSGFSNTLQNDLIAAIGDVVRYDIKEISAAPFVAAEVDKSTYVTKLRSLSLCG